MVTAPLSGINGRYVNTDNSHLQYFGSTDNSRSYGLSGAVNKSLAADASRLKGGCWWLTPPKKRKRMTKGNKKMKKRKTKRRKYRGGSTFDPYALVQKGGIHSVTDCNNGYSTGGFLPANQLGLANPVPYHIHGNYVNPHFPNQQLSY